MDETTTSAIEKRLRALEDQFAICQIVCAYGYAVDGLNGPVVESLYAPDGVYAVSDFEPKVGAKAIAATTTNPGHIEQVRQGCAHVSTLPYVAIDGDRASATCYTMLVRHDEHGFSVDRLSASRLELSRKPEGGWHIDHRQNQLLNENPEGAKLLARLRVAPGQRS